MSKEIERHGQEWDAEKCVCGSELVGCIGCCENRCLACYPYSEHERLNRCCTQSFLLDKHGNKIMRVTFSEALDGA